MSKLEDYQRLLADLDRGRQSDSSALKQAVDDLKTANDASRQETARLATALRDSRARGSWGELQLRRVLEHAGMLEHVDFVEQSPVGGVDQAGRPDVIVRLPNGRAIVIDAKAPLDRFLLAAEEPDPDRRRAHLERHGKAVHDHATALAKRRYDDLVEGAVDLVVMFIPGEAFLSAAFEARPTLLDDGLGQRVVVASPTSLMGLLRAVAIGWREQRVTEQAEQIAALGRELHERISVFADHLDTVGSSLGRAVESYTAAIGSLEGRVLVSTRRFEELGAASSRALDQPQLVDTVPRQPLGAGVPRPATTPPASDEQARELPPSEPEVGHFDHDGTRGAVVDA
jgi:DNA recombination protein RmuC